MDRWIRCGLRKAERTFALFTLTMWTARSGHDIGAVIDRLLSSLDPWRLLFAGRLMAEGVSVSDGMAIRVIDRLFALVCNVPYDIADDGFEVLGALFDYPAVPAQLDALAGDTKVRLSWRVSALAAFEQLQGGERAQLLLAELLPSVYGKSLQQCARIAVRLGQAAIDMTRQRALQMVGEPDSDVEKRTAAAEIMRTLGLVTNVADLARLVLQDTRATPGQLERAAEAWLAAQGETAVSEIAVVDRWSERSNGEGLWHLGRMLKQLAPYPEAAVVSRVRLLLERFSSTTSAHNLIDAWLAVEPAGGGAILDATDHGATLSTFNQAWSAQHLQDAGEHAAATELAERALRSPYGSRDDCERAASVLLKADRVAAVSQLVHMAEQNPKSAWLAGVMDALSDRYLETDRAAEFCALQLIAHSRVDGEELLDALEVLVILQGESAAQSVAEAARTRPELSFYQRRKIAGVLAALGQLDLARSIWAHLLTWQGYSDGDDVGLVEDFLNAGVEQWAAERMQELIDNPLTAPLWVQRLRQMLGWLTAACVQEYIVKGSSQGAAHQDGEE